MGAIARLGAVSLDSADAGALAEFYRQLLDLEIHLELAVDDLDQAEAAAVALGRSRPTPNPCPRAGGCSSTLPATRSA